MFAPSLVAGSLIKRFGVLNMAENACHNFHNLLPFRGAEVRDAKSWSRYIDIALDAFGGKADAMIAQFAALYEQLAAAKG